MTNRGTGAGGKNTNKNGLWFENITSIEPLLNDLQFTKNKDNCLQNDNGTLIYAYKNQLKKLFKKKFNIELTREPDEAFLIKNKNNSYTLKILEKKNQNGSGSVYDKLYTGVALREEYQWCIGDHDIVVEYAYCISKWMKTTYNNNSKRNKFLRQYHKRNGINVFYGEDNNYQQRLHHWVFMDK